MYLFIHLYTYLIDCKVGELRKSQNERLKVQFTENNKYNRLDATIESLTQTLTVLFRQSQIKVKKIENIKNRPILLSSSSSSQNEKNNETKINIGNENDNHNNNNNSISKEEQRMRLSAMRSRAKIIQKLSKDFRHLQRHFLESLVK